MIKYTPTWSSETDDMIRVDQLRKDFGAFTAVDNISFSVKRGAIYGFLGPNGAGKSTTIRMLCGLLQPTSGEGWVAGCDLKKESTLLRSRIGYMSQKFSLYEDLTVVENITFFSGIYNVPQEKKRERLDWILDITKLHDHRDVLTRDLAVGWKQHLALGCALVHQPSVLFLDEPTAGTDPLTRLVFWQLIQELSRCQVTIFVTTHYMDDAEYCHTIDFIHRGVIIASGSPHDLEGYAIPYKVIALNCNQPQLAMELVENLENVIESVCVGKKLHITFFDEEEGRKELLTALAREGISHDPLEIVHPSLEDVFLYLIDAREHPDKFKKLSSKNLPLGPT